MEKIYRLAVNLHLRRLANALAYGQLSYFTRQTPCQRLPYGISKWYIPSFVYGWYMVNYHPIGWTKEIEEPPRSADPWIGHGYIYGREEPRDIM